MARKTIYSLWEQVLPEWVCDGIVETGKILTNQLEQDSAGNETEGIGLDGDGVTPFWEPKHWINGLMMQYATMSSEELWQYSLASPQGTQFNTHSSHVDSNAEWQCDEFDQPFGSESPPMWQGLARKINVIANLSSPADYQGGNLVFKNLEGETINVDGDEAGFLQKGSVIVFPSYIYYKVTPVTSGTRYSTISWILGPPFR